MPKAAGFLGKVSTSSKCDKDKNLRLPRWKKRGLVLKNSA
jgi:hypothetical protein